MFLTHDYKENKLTETQGKPNRKMKLEEPKKESVEMPHKDTDTEAKTRGQKSLCQKVRKAKGSTSA